MNLNRVSHSFDPRGIAGIHDLSLSLVAGEIFVVMGASGAGKTTLLRILSGDINPTKGERDISASVSFINMNLEAPQDFTIQEWLMSAVKKKLSEEHKLQWARDLADIFEFPMQLKRRLSEVSEGQRQRVKLAYALMNGPELVLLDEPFAHLDLPLRSELTNLLHDYVKKRSITVVWVSHDTKEALSLADRVGILHFGKWQQVGTTHEIYWQPKTIVCAQLMGHKNLFSVSRATPEGPWSTPFGKWDSQGMGAGRTNLVLSLPTAAFKFDQSGPWSGEIQSIQFQGYHSEITITGQPQAWVILWSGPGVEGVKIGETRRFSVDLSLAMAIDCL
jgi:iron(III) transport system ATP-binding protein